MSEFLLPLAILAFGIAIGLAVAGLLLSGIMYFTFVLLPMLRDMLSRTEPKV